MSGRRLLPLSEGPGKHPNARGCHNQGGAHHPPGRERYTNHVIIIVPRRADVIIDGRPFLGKAVPTLFNFRTTPMTEGCGL